MQIDLDLLYSWGAVAKKYKKNETIFDENEPAHFYYQIIDGSVRLFSSNDDGKEYTHGIFYTGDSFGEPILFIEGPNLSKAITIQESVIIKLTKEKFLKILDDYPSIQKDFLILFAKKIYSKINTANEIINHNPEFRIIAFLNTFKKKSRNSADQILIPFTRQEIANYTGLSVETVIRVCIKLNDCSKLKIINHKIYF